jgi:hypothetical protein
MLNAYSRKTAGETQVADQLPGGEVQELAQARHTSQQKGLWWCKRMEKTLATILKRHVFKYPMMTTTKL